MSTWTRTGPVVVEVDGTAEGLRIVDYACLEAMRSGAELVLVTPYQAHTSFSPMTPSYRPKSPADLADAVARAAVAHLRHRYGYALQVVAETEEGSRAKVLRHAARHARMLVVGRTRARGPHRLLAAQSNLHLAARLGCPVVVVPETWKPSALDRNVAVGIDGTPLSNEALEFAFRAAADREGDLVVVHAGLPADHAGNDEDVDHSWIHRADQTLAEALAVWSNEFPEVRVTRFLSSRPAAAALVRESQHVGLVVVGSHAGPLPSDPVARRSIAAMTCPVAIVPHALTAQELELRRLVTAARRGEIVVPTY
ncbi:universal stress protein [Kribbella lupini]|uniref:Universal stress protein n=1 Tax=Kribbella lupini TaxID=291602 RepID=A0ABP4LDC9_9ACTN